MDKSYNYKFKGMGKCSSNTKKVNTTISREEEENKNQRKNSDSNNETKTQRKPSLKLSLKKAVTSKDNVKKYEGISLLSKAETKKDIIPINTNVFDNNKEENPLNYYEIISDLNESEIGILYLVKHNVTKSLRVLEKITKLERNNLKEINEKLSILNCLDNPSIVKIYETFTHENIYNIIKEYFPNGNLESYISHKKFLKENNVANIIFQILLAVNHSHSNNIIHRDINSETVFIEEIQDDQCLRISINQFGTLSLLEEFFKENQLRGSLKYMAPEILQSKSFDNKCDMWSVGILTYFLILGKTPFEAAKFEDTVKNILSGEVNLTGKNMREISTLVKDFIKKLLEKDPKKRINAFEAMQHKWFTKYAMKDRFTVIEKSKLDTYMSNILLNKSVSKLQQKCIGFIINNMPRNDEIMSIQKAFNSINTNLDGKISQEELIDYFKNYFKSKQDFEPKSEVESLFEKLDSEKKGYLNNKKFITVCIDKQYILKEKFIRNAFRCLNSDISYKVRGREIFKVLSKGVDNQTCKMILDVLKDLNINSEGIVSFSDFKKIIENILLN